MEIVQHNKVTKYSVYGKQNRRGLAIVELLRRGIVEDRYFEGQRGRSGKILRLRIAYDNEIVKQYIYLVVKKRKNE